MKQSKFNLSQGRWGGRRKNSGRKRLRSQGVAHRQREWVTKRTPTHITIKYCATVRNKETLRVLKRAIVNSRKQGLRVLHFSFQTNHIHLIIEADNNFILTRGMRSLTITFAKGVKRGKIQLHRYHLHVLKTIRETRNAIHYVLFNQQKHEKGICTTVNGFSSLAGMERGSELIQKYAKKMRRVVKVERGYWKGDGAVSYLFKRGIQELFFSAP